MRDEIQDSDFFTYWEESARPLTSLAFIIPMLLVYEGGLVFLGPQALRNGADVWLRRLLDLIGFGQYFLLPLLTCGLLLAWHHINSEKWLLRSTVLQGMIGETIAFGILLFLLARTHLSLVASMDSWNASATANMQTSVLAVQQMIPNAIAYFGAGVYEELLFRLILLPILVWILISGGFSRITSVFAGVALSSGLFAIVHYDFELQLVNGFVLCNQGETFEWASFSFRLMAGTFFSFLFLHRGFGVAAGAHAVYDILAVTGY